MSRFSESAKYAAVQTEFGQLAVHSLLEELEQVTALWFLANESLSKIEQDESLRLVIEVCVEILQHGLKLEANKSHKLQHKCISARDDIYHSNNNNENKSSVESDNEALERFFDDFEFLRTSIQLLKTTTVSCPKTTLDKREPDCATVSVATRPSGKTVVAFLRSWVQRCLSERCLLQCLQSLVSDIELLECYYSVKALLRNENYQTHFFICLTAFESNQSSLLCQIDAELRLPAYTNIRRHPRRQQRHSLLRRSFSQPNFSNSSITKKLHPVNKQEQIVLLPARSISVNLEQKPLSSSFNWFLPAFRRNKSLPCVDTNLATISSPMITTKPAQHCLIAASTNTAANKEDNLTKPSVLINAVESNILTSCSYDDIDMQPSTSASSTRSRRTINSATSNFSTTSSSVNSIQSLNSTTTARRRIELINCDNIKIWTDQSLELQKQQQQQHQEQQQTVDGLGYEIEQPVTSAIEIRPRHQVKKQANSISPLNSFLSNLFGTPPTYTSWSTKYINDLSYEHKCIDNKSTAVQAETASAPNLFESFLPVYGKKLRKRNSQNLFEDGVSTLDYAPSSACTKPTTRMRTVSEAQNIPNATEMPVCSRSSGILTPTKLSSRQSLTAFLQMSQLSRNNTELEKENAHFRVSEAVISAIEHIKWATKQQEPNEMERSTEATDWHESATKEKMHKTNNLKFAATDGFAEHDNDGDIDDDIITHIPYAAELEESGLDLLSAENVGLTLISKFNDRHLPSVSELKWLVNEDDTPQNLLPMPESTSATAVTTIDADGNNHHMMSIRGTKYWAPPRQQIIFTDHILINRKDQLKNQNNRCAGCGMLVSKQFMHSFRYCTYLGKYHCTGCHRNQISAIPAKILKSWDFKCYPVSVFAYRLLEQMYTYPLFYVPALNPSLYLKIKALSVASQKRRQLSYVKEFIKLCRFATNEQKYFAAIPEHITNDPDIWSMSDFVDVCNKSMKCSIDELIILCENHIHNCVLCTGRGFICEYCHKERIIYPWECKTYRCDRCGSCFHMNCWRSMLQICCKCQKLKSRCIKETNVIQD